MTQATNTEFYTVVYQVEGGKKRHDEWWQSVQPLFLGDGPVSITTIAAGDMLAKLEYLEGQDEERRTAYVRDEP